MKIVYRAGGVTEAEIVNGMLLANDIEAHVSGFYLQGGIGELAPTDLAKVHVPDEDAQRAREIIREYEGNQSDPVNTGTEAETENRKSASAPKFLLTIIIVIAISILSFWVGI